MQAIQIKYMRGGRLKAMCYGGSITEGRDYEVGPAKQAHSLAIKLAKKLDWKVVLSPVSTLPNGDWVVTIEAIRE